jgi:hypothetical protein
MRQERPAATTCGRILRQSRLARSARGVDVRGQVVGGRDKPAMTEGDTPRAIKAGPMA